MIMKALPFLVLFLVSVEIFGLTGFYLFGDKVKMFGTISDAMLYAFTIATKDSWTRIDLEIEEAIGTKWVRLYSVVNIVILGTVFSNLMVAAFSESMIKAHQNFDSSKKKKEVRRLVRRASIRRYNSMSKEDQKSVEYLRGVSDLREFIECIEQGMPVNLNMVLNSSWISAFLTSVDMKLEQVEGTIERIRYRYEALGYVTPDVEYDNP